MLQGLGGCAQGVNVTFSTSATQCSTLGARLCSAEELHLGEGDAAKCGDNSRPWSWTSSGSCPSGFRQAVAESGNWFAVETQVDTTYQITIHAGVTIADHHNDLIRVEGMYDDGQSQVGGPLIRAPHCGIDVPARPQWRLCPTLDADDLILRWESDLSGTVYFFVGRSPGFEDSISVRVSPIISYAWQFTDSHEETPHADEPQSTTHSLHDDTAVSVELPFPFPLFESNYTNVSILDNGALFFGDVHSAPVSKTEVGQFCSQPSGASSEVCQILTGHLVAPRWTDLHPEYPGATVVSTAFDDRLTVRWTAPSLPRHQICEGVSDCNARVLL